MGPGPQVGCFPHHFLYGVLVSEIGSNNESACKRLPLSGPNVNGYTISSIFRLTLLPLISVFKFVLLGGLLRTSVVE